MKKRVHTMIYLMLPLMFLGLAGNLAAADINPFEKKLGIGVGVGYPVIAEDQFSSDVSFSLNLFYSLSKSLRLELKVTNMSNTIDEGTEPTDLAQGRVWLTPLQVSLQYRIKMSDRILPYLTLGAGYYLKSYDFENLEGWETAGFTIQDEMDNVFGFHAGLGFDYHLSNRMLFSVDARYCFVSLTGTYNITEIETGIIQTGDIDSDINPMIFSAGFTYLF